MISVTSVDAQANCACSVNFRYTNNSKAMVSTKQSHGITCKRGIRKSLIVSFTTHYTFESRLYSDRKLPAIKKLPPITVNTSEDTIWKGRGRRKRNFRKLSIEFYQDDRKRIAQPQPFCSSSSRVTNTSLGVRVGLRLNRLRSPLEDANSTSEVEYALY